MFRTTKWAMPILITLLTSGCGGGGGVGSTPTPTGTPTPTPTPSGSPTPTPTPGTSPSPTPTATPAPTVNLDLTGTLKSESFTNNAVNAKAHFTSSQTPPTNTSSAYGALTVSYDATTQSYTVSTAGRTTTFAPADLVVSGSSDFTAYQKIGATSEALTLTRPGSSGALTYRYVAGGAWERAIQSNGQLDFTYDPFTYGVETPDASMKRTGQGLYAVSLVGSRAMEAPFAVAGSGTMQVDFGANSLTSSGVLTSIDVQSGLIKGIGLYFGSAAISSTTNNFQGDFFMDDGKRFTGGWAGRFYGPNSEEVGASWYLSSADGEVAAGYLIGREDATVEGVNTSLTSLLYSEEFDTRFSELSFKDLGNGTADVNGALLRSDSAFSYDAVLNAYRYVDSARGIDTQFGASSLVPGESTSSVAVYRITGSNGLTYKLTLSKPGAGNPTIALTYTSFANWQQAQGASTDRADRWFTYGVRTNGFQIPTGTGHFDGIIRGTGVRSGGGAIYALSGTSSFDMNFSSSSFTGSLNPIGTASDGSTRNFGTFSFARGAIDMDAGLTADIVNGSSNYLGFFEGALYGPKATEVGGSFGMQTEPSNGTLAPDAAYLSGVIVGKRTN